MATRYAVQDGPWSDTATWNGGTLPASVDDVHSNTFTVLIDQDVTVNTLRNTAGTGITAGGYFNVDSGDRTLTVTGTILAAHMVGTGALLSLNGTGNLILNSTTVQGGGGSVNNRAVVTNAGYSGTLVINGNVSSTAGYALHHAGTGLVTINGSVTGGSATSAHAVNHTGAGNLVITGNVTGGSSASAYGLNASGSASVTVEGNVTGGSSASAYGLNASGSASVTVEGNVTGGSSNAYGLNASGSASVTVEGNVTGGSTSAYGLNASGSASVTVEGNVTGSSSSSNAYGLNASGSASVTVEGNVTGGSSSTGAYGLNASETARVLLHAVTASRYRPGVGGATDEGSPIVIRGPIIDSSYGVAAVACARWVLDEAGDFLHQIRTAEVTWPMSAQDAYANLTIYGTNLPVAEDVREGVAYGEDGLIEGTLIVPAPESVAAGVPTDDTVGTATLSLADLAAVTGAQIAAALSPE